MHLFKARRRKLLFFKFINKFRLLNLIYDCFSFVVSKISIIILQTPSFLSKYPPFHKRTDISIEDILHVEETDYDLIISSQSNYCRY